MIATSGIPRRSVLSALLPFASTLREYTFRDLKADALAAATVAPIAIPQAMAYAVIAGVHPKYGLYACILPVIVAALWGSARFLAAGPTNAISMILFSTLGQVSVGGVLILSMPEDARMSYIFGIAILTGVIQIAMGLARLGELANFISHSVMVAFMTGAAALIAAGQIKNLLGLHVASTPGFFPQLHDTLLHLHQTNFWSLGTAACTILCILLLRRVSTRLPSSLIALTLVSLGAWLLDLQQHGVRLAGAIPRELPPLSLPPMPDLRVIRDLFLPALAIALLGAVESLAIGKNLSSIKGDHFNGSQELAAQGLGNVAAGLTSGIPGCGSFTRSALNVAAGGRTCFATVFSGVFTVPLLLLLAPLAEYIPMPSLAGILIVISIGMINKRDIALCLRATRIDRAVLLVTFGATLLLDLEQAVFLGVLLSLTLFLYKVSHPRVERLTPDSPLMAPYPWAAHCPQLAVYVIEGTLFFGAINELERRLHAEESSACRVAVLHLARVFWVDASGAHALEQFMEHCLARSIPLVLVVGNKNVQDILQRTGLLDHLGEGFVAHNLQDALYSAYTLLLRSTCSHCEEEHGPCPIPPDPWPGAPLPPGEGYETRDLAPSAR